MNNLSTFSRTNIVIVSLALLLTGCAGLGKSQDYKAKLNDFSVRTELALAKASNHISLTTNSSKRLCLNELIEIPALNAYITQALDGNPELQQSIQALNIVYYQADIVSAQLQPSVELGVSGQRTEDVVQNRYTTALSTSWEIDLWNKLNDEKNAALLDIESQKQELAQVRNLLVTNVMRAWLDIALQQKLIEIEYSRLENQLQNLELIESRYGSGLDNLDSLDNARASVSQTKANIADKKQQKFEAKQTLNLLVGVFSTEVKIEDSELFFPEVLMPTAYMPVQNLSQRPDVRASFFSIEAEAFRTDAAYKAMLPSLSLSATLSDTDTSPLASLLTDPIWQILGQLSAPIFQGGRLSTQASIAELELAQQVWIYQETLLEAISEVEIALSKETNLKAQQEHLQDAIESAQRSYYSFREKYQQGLVDIFDLLSTQEQTYDLQSQLIQVTYNRLANRIDLGLALGLGVI